MINPKVSVVIPTLDRTRVLQKTLEALLRQNYPDFEIIVIDQTGQVNQNFLNFLKKNQSKIQYLTTQDKSSPKARNLGVKAATGEIILFLDDDVEISGTKFILYHVQNYQNPEVGLVGGRVVEKNGQKKSKKSTVGRLKWWGLKEVTNFNGTTKMWIDHAAGGNFSVYKRIYDQVGGFAAIYKGNAHMEETDFCLRVKRAGYRLIFEPKAVLVHLAYPSGGNRTRDIYEFRYWLVHNGTVFYLKNYPRVLFPLFYLDKLGWALGSALKRRDGKMLKTMVKALDDGMKYQSERSRKINK